VLLLLDEGFFCADGALLDAAAEARDVAASVAELDAVVGGLRETAQAPVIAATLALPPELQAASADRAMAGARVRQVLAVNAALAEAAAAGRVLLFDLAALAARIGTDVFFDPVRFLQAKAPFSFEASPVVADGVAALVAAMCGRSGRVLALDLDNTLWGGGIADDGLDGIALGQGSPEGEAFVAVQRHALGLRRRGVVLAVCSKNSEAIAREPFRSHPDMLLREEHISAFVANFDDKASNLARIAATLDLDPSALVLLDDNPAERERVRSALPWVVVPELADDPALFVRALISSGAFEHLPLTFEDTVRVGAYEARAEAEALRDSLGDYDAYLASLDMALSIAPFDAIGRARIVQLIQKSNQFNMTTRRYTEPEIEALQADLDCLTWQVRLRDRFADHGMISAMVVRKAPGAWTIDSWVMSCRVLERGVEAALIGELARTAAACGVRELRGLYRPTARNGLVRDLYAKLGFEAGAADADGAVTWRLDPTIACFAAAPMRIAIAAAPAVASAG
jgi:FkbH-like protein